MHLNIEGNYSFYDWKEIIFKFEEKVSKLTNEIFASSHFDFLTESSVKSGFRFSISAAANISYENIDLSMKISIFLSNFFAKFNFSDFLKWKNV